MAPSAVEVPPPKKLKSSNGLAIPIDAARSVTENHPEHQSREQSIEPTDFYLLSDDEPEDYQYYEEYFDAFCDKRSEGACDEECDGALPQEQDEKKPDDLPLPSTDPSASPLPYDALSVTKRLIPQVLFAVAKDFLPLLPHEDIYASVSLKLANKRKLAELDWTDDHLIFRYAARLLTECCRVPKDEKYMTKVFLRATRPLPRFLYYAGILRGKPGWTPVHDAVIRLIEGVCDMQAADIIKFYLLITDTERIQLRLE